MQELKDLDLLGSFPYHLYPELRENQKLTFEKIQNLKKSLLLELPSGSGKSVIGYTFLKACQKIGMKIMYYIVPTKQLVDQMKSFFPELVAIYGRNEYPCLYYTKSEVTAEQAPCSMLKCPHRISADTGETEEAEVEPCPYLAAKYRAKHGGIIVCTMSFYLFTYLFSRGGWEEIDALVIDEVHLLPDVIRYSLSYEISEYSLNRIVKLLHSFNIEEASIIEDFRRELVKITSVKKNPVLLEDTEIRGLLEILGRIKSDEFGKKVRAKVKHLDMPIEEGRDILKKMEVITRDLFRYYRNLEYSLDAEEKRKPLNYTFGFCEERQGKEKNVVHIKAYYVPPLIRKILPPLRLSYSATIGNADTFSAICGINDTFFSFNSDFPPENTRIFMPTDTPNLAKNELKRGQPKKVLTRIAKACKLFTENHIRSLVIVVSNDERSAFLEICKKEKVNVISYGAGLSPRSAATRFKQGEGDVLAGTEANYGEGIDLPKRLAPVIFDLRPAYPNPFEPEAVFEKKRWGNAVWKIWKWRVMQKFLQKRGRNIRLISDIGVTILISQQFKSFAYASLPEWLQPSYVGDKTFDECIEEAIKMLKR